MDDFRLRKPWATALISYLCGPVVAFLYLGSGGWAAVYLFLILAASTLPFLLVHYSYLTVDPRLVAALALVALQWIGVAHSFGKARRLEIRSTWYSSWYALLALCFVTPLVLISIVRTCFFDIYVARNLSMEPEIYANDHFLVDKEIYGRNHNPKRGDVVVLRVADKSTFFHNLRYVRRIIGLPGDDIMMLGDDIVINNVPIPYQWQGTAEDGTETFTGTLPGGKEIRFLQNEHAVVRNEGMTRFSVPDDHYFVVGDNHSQSRDSRNGLGMVDRKDLLGQAKAVIWNSKTYQFIYQPID